MVVLGVIVAIGGSGYGAVGGGLTLTAIGLALSWFPLRKVIRAYKGYRRVMAGCRGDEHVLGGTAGPAQRHGGRTQVAAIQGPGVITGGGCGGARS